MELPDVFGISPHVTVGRHGRLFKLTLAKPKTIVNQKKKKKTLYNAHKTSSPAPIDRVALTSYLGIRPTKSIVYVPLQVNRFQESILLIVQYKCLRSCSRDFIFQNLILCTRSCYTGFVTQSSWLFISTRPSWSDEHVLYHSCTSSDGVSWRGQPLNILT